MLGIGLFLRIITPGYLGADIVLIKGKGWVDKAAALMAVVAAIKPVFDP